MSNRGGLSLHGWTTAAGQGFQKRHLRAFIVMYRVGNYRNAGSGVIAVVFVFRLRFRGTGQKFRTAWEDQAGHGHSAEPYRRHRAGRYACV
jgi:hypothetical protein